MSTIRVKRRIPEIKLICHFNFYSNKKVFIVSYSGTTEPKLYHLIDGRNNITMNVIIDNPASKKNASSK